MSIDLNNVYLIAVHYKNTNQTIAFANQIKDWGIHAIIVDNSAQFKKLEFEHPNITILHFEDNPGYFGGIQRAFLTIKHKKIERLIVSNTDIEFADNFIESLQSSSCPNHVAVMAPKIISSISKLDINPLYCTKPLKKKMIRLNRIFKSYLGGALWQLMGWVYTKLKQNPKTQNIEYIYAPHGALMIFTQFYFEKKLDFNYPIFLYGEEIWVAENVISKNLRIQYNQTLKAKHVEHGSLGILPSKIVWKAHRDSNQYILEHFFKNEF